MELIRGQHNLPLERRGWVATIGNFDGVHLGHRRVVERLAIAGKRRGLPSLVITFEPHPAELFAPGSAPARLTCLREKIELLSELPVDAVLCLRFDRRLASMPAEDFVRDLLMDRLCVRHLEVGDDFRFGRDRQGDFSLLQRLAGEHGCSVERAETCVAGAARVSSTRVRQALARYDLAEARRLLGRDYGISGRVAHGDRVGRTLGFPTANVHLKRRSAPITGVYAVSAQGLAGGARPGVANLGRRPTRNGTRLQLEVHLFDFDRDIYGHHLRVDLLAHLRAERQFGSLDALRLQIARDAERARHFFWDHPPLDRMAQG